ncbi:MAG TPA: ABC transporter permease subunit [Chitinophagaceae bacterium]|nr:ABC transporter permease subunit [Chitinophagaceae bacterium]
MRSLVQLELYKIFRKPRTYIAFGVITALVVIMQIGFYLDGETFIDFAMQPLRNSFVLEGNIMNGYFMCFMILQLLLIHVPILIALVSGDMVSGEAGMGTLRLLLTKPISRTGFLFSKFFAASVYTLLLLIWMAFLGLAVSLMIFGGDDLVVFKSEVVTFILEDDVLWRYGVTFAFALLAMLTVASLAFMLSVFAENSIGPIVTTVCIIILFTIFSTIDIPVFQSIRPFLFTSHMLAWKGFFDVQVNAANEAIVGSIEQVPALLTSAGVLVLHIAAFLGIGTYTFQKKDILS